MSLLPLVLNDHWYSTRPHRLVDQHFGLGLDVEDLIAPLTIPSDVRAMMRHPAGYYRPWRSAAAKRDSGSTIIANKDRFEVNLDVQQFAPEEITVKVTGNNTITVEGKHEEKQDHHGFVSRHFVRKYTLPEGHDIDNVVSNLSSDGVLSITAPRVTQENEQHRSIPIQQTGVPMKAVKHAKPKEDGDAKK